MSVHVRVSQVTCERIEGLGHRLCETKETSRFWTPKQHDW